MAKKFAIILAILMVIASVGLTVFYADVNPTSFLPIIFTSRIVCLTLEMKWCLHLITVDKIRLHLAYMKTSLSETKKPRIAAGRLVSSSPTLIKFERRVISILMS